MRRKYGSGVSDVKWSRAHPFGRFRYNDLDGGRIEIEADWRRKNIVRLALPPLENMPHVTWCHRLAHEAFLAVFNDIRFAGDDKLIRHFDGLWVPRHILWNPRKPLSNHSWGTAIDLNAKWNLRI